MTSRNIPRINDRMIEFEVVQQMHNQHHPEPYILAGSPPNFPLSNTHQILPPSGSMMNFDVHHLPEHHDGTAFYRTPHYAYQLHPVTNLELGVPAPSNFYNPYLNPAFGARMFHLPQNHASMDQLPSSRIAGESSAHLDGYGMNIFAPGGSRGLSKRNITEGSMGNNQYFNTPAAPSSSMAPLNACHFDGGVAVVDGCFPLPEYRGNLMGQSFQHPAATWCDHQPNGAGDSSALSFDRPMMSHYFEGSSEVGSAGGQRFHEGATTSSSANFLHATPMLHSQNDFHRVHDANYRHPAVATSSRQPINDSVHYVGMSHTQQGPQPVPPPPGIRTYQSHRRSVMPEGINRNPDLPHLRLLRDEGLAILEFPGHYEVSSTVDHHRDMRLDIDYMSYEELLALSEQIGNVNTGLSDEDITTYLKTRTHRSSMITVDLEELPCSNDINDSCIICQEEYEDSDEIGILKCAHEYHVDCLKKWLPLKNTCPICKSTALQLNCRNR